MRPRLLSPALFRVLFLSVLRCFSLFFRPARSLKTGSRVLLHRAGRPAGRLHVLALARTRSRVSRHG